MRGAARCITRPILSRFSCQRGLATIFRSSTCIGGVQCFRRPPPRDYTAIVGQALGGSRAASHAARERGKKGTQCSNRKFADDRHAAFMTWADCFNELFPESLGGTDPVASQAPASAGGFSLQRFVDILADRSHVASSRGGTIQNHDVITWMIHNGRRKQALWLVHAAQKSIAAQGLRAPPQHPSNIVWPTQSFNLLEVGPLDDEDVDFDRQNAGRPLYQDDLPSSSESPSLRTLGSRAEALIWRQVANLILSATSAAEGTPIAQAATSAALLIIGNFHNLGLMPDRVYEAPNLSHSSHLHRNPVLHLLSSRILTCISDAAWCEHQDDAIARARELGQSSKQISETVPGGRFRLRVIPLGPEIWLDLIISSCIELGYIDTAAIVLDDVTRRAQNQWLAARWSSPERTSDPDVPRASVDVPANSVSTETILRLVDAILSGTGLKTKGLQEPDLRQIRKIMHRLRPDELSTAYFEYLQSRAMHNNTFHYPHDAVELAKWCVQMDQFGYLHANHEAEPASLDLGLSSIMRHTTLSVAFKHQAMHGLIQLGAIHNALPLFNEIQEKVDQSKFNAIKDFLQCQPDDRDAFFSSRSSKYRLEYADSYGQLPYNVLAALLDLITESRLIGLGQWLLYSDDIDGPLIPEDAYGLSTLTAALCRFAAVSQDDVLYSKAVSRAAQTGLMPTVRLLRTQFDTDVAFLDFQNAKARLEMLRGVKGGGFGTSDLATLAALILRLEAGLGSDPAERPLLLHHASGLMRMILAGQYNSKGSHYTLYKQRLFAQQIAHMLRIFAYFEQSCLSGIARDFAPEYVSGNLVCLDAKVFNIILSGVADTRGAIASQELWKNFCQEPAIGKDHGFPIQTAEEDLGRLADNHSYLEEDGLKDPVPAVDEDVDAFAHDHVIASAKPEHDLHGTATGDPDKAKAPFSGSGLQRENGLIDSQASISNEVCGSVSMPDRQREVIGLVHSVANESGRAGSVTLDHYERGKEVAAVAKADDTPRPAENAGHAHATDDADFMDPFFINRPLGEQSVEEDNTRTHRLDSQQVARTQVEGNMRSLLDPRIVTVPNLQTLRIIVRAAINERQASGLEEQSKHILAWTLPRFNAMGINAAQILTQEVQQPLSDLVIVAGDRISMPESDTPASQVTRRVNSTEAVYRPQVLPISRVQSGRLRKKSSAPAIWTPSRDAAGPAIGECTSCPGISPLWVPSVKKGIQPLKILLSTSILINQNLDRENMKATL